MLWVLVLVAVVAAVLLVPVSVDLSIRRQGTLIVSAASRWGPFSLPRSEEAASPAPRPAPRRRRGARSLPNPRKLRALLFSRDFLPSLFRLARRLLRQMRPRELELRLRAGLGDPADTGRLWGTLVPLALLVTSSTAGSIRIEPDFAGPSFELDGHARLRVVPAFLLLAVLGYCFTPPPWRALSQYVRVR